MKKIAPAVFSLMFAGVSYVGAQSVKVDFDGRNALKNGQAIEKFSIQETFLDIEYNIPAPKKEAKFEVKKNNTQPIYKGVTKEMLDNSIKSAIEHCKKNKFDILEKNFNKLLEKGTMEEKYKFVYNNKESYNFPKRIVKFRNKNIKQDFNNLVKVGGTHTSCIASHEEEVCDNKEVCTNVCHAGTIVCYIGSGGNSICTPLAAGCYLSCTLVPECRMQTICDEWGETIAW